MTKLARFRRRMQSYRQAADRQAKSRKDPHFALDRLHCVYRKFDVYERTMANQVLAEWSLSEDEKLRFDALALIDEFMVAKAVPALRKLAGRIELCNSPALPYELDKVIRIIGKLAHV